MEQNTGKIQVEYWLKSDMNWFQPTKEVDLSGYDKLELLSTGFYGDLFYAYNKNTGKENGRLFRGRWNKGIV